MARPGTEEHVMRTVYLLLCASAMLAWLALPAEAAKTYQYSERVQHACANDYRAHCGNGQVSRAEVERRKRTGR